MTTPTILCVDDDPEMLVTVARVLRRAGHAVMTAEAPLAALELLRTTPIAVLVSDFEMPEMNGVELSVRAREVQPETVRIMLTGKRTVETAIEGINVAEVFRFLSKPFEPDALQREVAAALAHHAELVAVARERLTVVRRRQLVEALEHDHPGISTIERDAAGVYLIDGAARRDVRSPLVEPILALFAEPSRQP